MTFQIPQLPTFDSLFNSAHDWPFHVSTDSLKLYAEISAGAIEELKVLEQVSPYHPTSQNKSVKWEEVNAEENRLNAWVTKTRLKACNKGILEAKTIAVKDSIAVAGIPMRNGNQSMRDYIPTVSATAVERILEHGGTIIGKAQCESYCQGAQSATSYPSPVLNFHDVTRSAGGSSSGSASLVASGEVDMAIGTDSGGSIRVPASYCGVVGLKPTFGLVPFTGAASLEMSLEHMGPITKNVIDNAKLLSVIAGFDRFDPRQIKSEREDYHSDINKCPVGISIGLVREGFEREGINQQISLSIKHCLSKHKFSSSTCSLPALLWGEKVHLCLYLIGMSRQFTHGSFPSNVPMPVDEGLSKSINMWLSEESTPESLKLSLTLGRYLDVESAGTLYTRCQNLRFVIREQIDQLLDKFDVLCLPTALNIAPHFAQNSNCKATNLLFELTAQSNTTVFNVSGHPCISIPAGKIQGMPFGVMLVAKHFDEAKLYQIANELEIQFTQAS